MYPLNLSLPNGAGFAVANNKAEHAALSAHGYQPALIEAKKPSAHKAPAVPDSLLPE